MLKQIDLTNLINITNDFKNIFNGFSRFPKIQRDIAIIVNKEITWQEIRQKIIDISGELLHNIELFDIYFSAQKLLRRCQSVVNGVGLFFAASSRW